MSVAQYRFTLMRVHVAAAVRLVAPVPPLAHGPEPFDSVRRAVGNCLCQLFKEAMMNMKLIGRNIALIVVFGALGLTLFTENVRTVQVLGLLACGACCGASLSQIVQAFRSKETKA